MAGKASMADTVPEAVAVSTRRSRRPLAIVAAVAAVLIAGAAVLWGWYGTAVFYEIIAAGIAMCL